MRAALANQFLSELQSRRLIHQKTAELSEPNFQCRPVVYVGFDPSAESLHAGSLIPLLTLDRFRSRGGQIIVLLGGATGLIGDPSGKDHERVLENESVVKERILKLQSQIHGFFASTDGPEPIFVNNADWYRSMNVVSFLRDVGKSFTVNQMLARESVRSRIHNRDQGISFTEFSYQILQAYDYLHLFREYNCTLQMGASDQWGNIVGGTDLVRRLTNSVVHGLTLPLLTNSAGKKYGKSEKGAIWLDSGLTSPYDFYQFWYNSTDSDAPKFLHWLTNYTDADIQLFRTELPSKRLPQKMLAEWLTARIHGKEKAELAKQASEVIFSGKYGNFSPDLIDMLERAVPTFTVSSRYSCTAINALVGLNAAKSSSEARRLLTQGSVALNGKTVTDLNEPLSSYSVYPGVAVMTVGKSRRFLIRFLDTIDVSSS